MSPASLGPVHSTETRRPRDRRWHLQVAGVITAANGGAGGVTVTDSTTATNRASSAMGILCLQKPSARGGAMHAIDLAACGERSKPTVCTMKFRPVALSRAAVAHGSFPQVSTPSETRMMFAGFLCNRERGREHDRRRERRHARGVIPSTAVTKAARLTAPGGMSNSMFVAIMQTAMPVNHETETGVGRQGTDQFPHGTFACQSSFHP